MLILPFLASCEEHAMRPLKLIREYAGDDFNRRKMKNVTAQLRPDLLQQALACFREQLSRLDEELGTIYVDGIREGDDEVFLRFLSNYRVRLQKFRNDLGSMPPQKIRDSAPE